VRRQCGWCGAPLRSGAAACRFCGTDVPIERPALGGPALCVCSVIAAWRCDVCDAAVCQQHRDRFWPGQARGNLRLHPDEDEIWYATVESPASFIRQGAPEACTVCRAEVAGDLIDRYRTIQKPLSPHPFDRMRSYGRAGIWIPSLFTRGDAIDVLFGLVNDQNDRRVPVERLAVAWKVKNSVIRKVISTTPARLFTVGRSGHVLAFDDGRWAVAGPFTAKVVDDTIVPDPNARDTTRVPYVPRGTANLHLDHANYSLRWRTVARGWSATDLGVTNFRDLVAPVVTS